MPSCVNEHAADPKVWGSAMWAFLFALSIYGHPTISFGSAVAIVIDAIPCQTCHRHATDYLLRHVPPRTQGMAAFRFLHAMQNDVNKTNVPLAAALERRVVECADMRKCAAALRRKLIAAAPFPCADSHRRAGSAGAVVRDFAHRQRALRRADELLAVVIE